MYTLPENPSSPAMAGSYFLGNFSGKNGGRTRTRTLDPLIKSQLLYQLSYAPTGRRDGVTPSGKPLFSGSFRGCP